jgi:hypothetical protein
MGNDLRNHALNSTILDGKKFSADFYAKLYEVYTSR